MNQLRQERDKLIDISSELKGQMSRMEKEKEVSKRRNEQTQSEKQLYAVQDELKESKLDMLRLEVEQMRNLVSQFKIENKEAFQERLDDQRTEVHDRIVEKSYNPVSYQRPQQSPQKHFYNQERTAEIDRLIDNRFKDIQNEN